MVLWALGAAYSHYYALVAVGIMMFFTGVAGGLNTAVRPGEKVYWQSWHFDRLCSLAVFFLCGIEKCQQRLVDDGDPRAG